MIICLLLALFSLLVPLVPAQATDQPANALVKLEKYSQVRVYIDGKDDVLALAEGLRRTLEYFTRNRPANRD